MNIWTMWMILWKMLLAAPGCQCASNQGRRECKCVKTERKI